MSAVELTAAKALPRGLRMVPRPTAAARARELDDAQIVRAVVGGEDELFAELVRRYAPPIHRLMASILGPHAASEAEDAAQEVFLLAHRKLASFRSESRFSTWLYRLAYRRGIDYLRSVGRRPQVAAGEDVDRRPAGSASPQAALVGAESDERLRRAVEGLDEPHRTTVYLRYWWDCSIREIAELLGTKEGTVKSQLHRARLRLARSVAAETRR